MMRKAIRASRIKPYIKVSATQPNVPMPFHPMLARFGWAVVFVFAASIPASFIFFPVYEIVDERGMKPHDAIGIVTWRSNPSGDGIGSPTIRSTGSQAVSVRVNQYDAYFEWGKTVQIGDRFDVTYRIGKSGRIYVDRVNPASTKLESVHGK